VFRFGGGATDAKDDAARRISAIGEDVKRTSHGKLKLANSCWQTQFGVCEWYKNIRQTRWQTVGDN